MIKKEYCYSKSIEEIESILAKIESGETDIDDLSDAIKRATKLLHECKETLLKTEQEVEKVLDIDNNK
jgi:exodeoxyribonuclease VII small subunit